MKQFQVGFGRVNVTPMMGIAVLGYYKPRYAEGVLDELEACAVALSDGDTNAVLISIDHCGIFQLDQDAIRKHISEVCGIPAEAVFLSTTHTHTGPVLDSTSGEPMEPEYRQFVTGRLADAAKFALEDLKPAKLGWAIGNAPNIAFVRRFRMKDGSTRTNPGVGNPDILEPLGDVDERVNVLRFDRKGADTIVLVNFGNHPDVVGGNLISADWPGFLRRRVEKALDGTKCIFFNGCQGDVNHVNVNAKDGDLNDMFMDFDDVSRGYGHARHMGNVVAGAVLQVYDKVNYCEPGALRFLQRTIEVPANLPKPEEMSMAHHINALHTAGKDAELPYQGMQLTTVVAEAERMVRLEHGPDSFPMHLFGIAIGDIALFGIPGEPFTGIGRALKEASGWKLVLPCCLTGGAEGYFPTQDAYDEGGYEARSSPFRSGVAELLTQEGLSLLAALEG